MKVVCIDDYGFGYSQSLSGKKIKGLTVGNIYDVIDFTERITLIIDDNGVTNWYNDRSLMPLEKYRELKLNELGI
jgi:hypothetical protein